MGENISITQAISITISSMGIVFTILFVISCILDSFKVIFREKEMKEVKKTLNETQSDINELSKEVNNLEEDEDEKVISALLTSIIASEGIDQPNFHIKSIKRIK